MNVELFIARHINFRTDTSNRTKKTPLAIRIATCGVAMGMAIMIVAVSIVIGFKNEISQKVIGFGSHIQLSGTPYHSSYETSPISIIPAVDTILNTQPEIKDYALFTTKPGILKTDTDFLGIALKGVTSDYPTDFISRYILEGHFPNLSDASNEILVSQYIADKLKLKLGDAIHCYFVEENVRARKFTISGIYKTNLSEYDKLFIYGDARHVQRLNSWAKDQYSGIEIRLNDIDDLENVNQHLYSKTFGISDKYGNPYFTQTIRELNPQIFNWLDLLDINVWIILILMALVSGFTMISGLLIIILERTRMIGILKALGTSNLSIRKVFLYVASFLVGKGLLWGNIIGIVLCLIQKYTHILKLDPEVYYIPSVPVELNIGYILLLNIAGFIISYLMLVGPSYIITSIKPAKSIKFE